MHKTSYDVQSTLTEMAIQLNQYLDKNNITDPLVIGIRTAGVWLAEHLHQELGLPDVIGELNINFYRDDFSRIGLHPQITPSNLPFSIEDRHIILVDDVLFTGRTIRAAMNELYDFGRPSSIILAILFEREGRELPIAAQVTGIKQDLDANQYISLSGPENMQLRVGNK
ncbi:MAG: bifunctional pyr operon transcriptional regulator/uracil phosphoribosyltransferase PyrR [Thiotrichaceae bacterium]|nr:bifunctional pyr operon transcriptional regulator/uracil phosphoribosyltransferase PyrR [Thiotrichaceae bacterium]